MTRTPSWWLIGTGLMLAACGGAGAGLTTPPAPVASVTVTPAAATVGVGTTVQLTVTMKDAAGSVLTGRAVTWATSPGAVATVSSAGLVTGTAAGSATITATSEAKTGTAAITVTAPVASVTVTPDPATVAVRHTLRFVATPKDAAGNPIVGLHVAWGTSNPAIAIADSTGLVVGVMAESVTVTASTGGRSGAARLSITPSSLPIRGLFVSFERRGWPAEYWSGQTLQQFDSLDPVVGTTVAAEVGLQLDVMHSLGVNTITYTLETSDSTNDDHGFTLPTCILPAVGGFRWPQPTAHELANLVPFFDLVESKGMHVLLSLINTHMEEVPPTNSATWLGAILSAIGHHPALELVLFGGAPHAVDTNNDGIPDVCGYPAEPPLWEGSTSVAARYVQWAIGYARSLGLPARKLTAEAIVGDYYTLNGGGGNLTDPFGVEKEIFDALQIPDSERTYGVSFYEHRKCSTARDLPCGNDVDPDQWADSTLEHIFSVIGPWSRARVVASEMGYLPPVDASWSTSQTFRSLVTRMRSRGMDGGAFWLWVSGENSDELDPTAAEPVKRRGVSFTYNPVKDAMVEMYRIP